MNFETKRAALEKIYALHDEFAAGLDAACRKGCAICCTANVTVTTLEGFLMRPQIEACGQTDRLATADNRGFRPTITTNHMAALCKDGKELPEESMDPAPGPCPLLTDQICPVYAVRPFGCRSMVSSRNCAETGMADMDEWVITVNHLFMQFIEHLDGNGCSGNLADVLAVLSDPEKRAEFEAAKLICRTTGLIPNRPIPVLMIPPEYQDQAMPLVEKLRACVSG
ncbi:MAG: hypothetical protein JEZ11_05835 [Desulfobacterales bacterium]|nr:hypothetical protein [Desulfobacterales bacterium]